MHAEAQAATAPPARLGRGAMERLQGFALAAARSDAAPLVLPSAAYLGTLLPGVGHSGDSAQLSMCAHLLAVPHPTGYPLYLGIVHGLGRLLPVNPALVANLFSALCAILVLAVARRLLSQLGAGRAASWTAVWAFALSPTFWEHAVTAEVYTFHALLLTLAVLLFVRWATRHRERDFYGACFVYALAFGNHILMVTLLPAIVVLVLSVRPRSFLEPRRVASVLAIIVVCAAQYGLLLARGADGAAPYREDPINGLGDLLRFATGAKFHPDMFAFGAADLYARLRSFLEAAVRELGPLVFFVPIGVARLGASPVNAFLGLAFLGNLAFALGYAITDLPPYYIPNHLLASVYMALGFDAVVRRSQALSPRRGPWLVRLAVAWTLGLGTIRQPDVVQATKPSAGDWAQEVLVDLGPDAIVISAYQDYQFLLYYRLAEGKRSGPYLADESVDLGEVIEYLRDGKPMKLRQLGVSAPPGLELYSQRLFNPRQYQRAGLKVEPFRHELYRLTYPTENQ